MYISNHTELRGQLDICYDQFIDWADEFHNASRERKRMIICELFNRIEVGTGYIINMILNPNYAQFLKEMDDVENQELV